MGICFSNACDLWFIWQYDETKAQERLERKIKKAPPEQGTVRMLTREEWDEIQEVRPRTPFESKLARPNARLRTGEPLHLVSFLIIGYSLACFIVSYIGLILSCRKIYGNMRETSVNTGL